jgi:hypothetical protein
MLTRKAARVLTEWNPVSPRMISAGFETKFQKTTIIQVYAPTNNANEDFYFSLQTTANAVPKRDILLIKSDFNAVQKLDQRGFDENAKLDPMELEL